MALLAQLALSTSILTKLTILIDPFFSSKVPKVSIVPSHFLHGDIDDIGDIANFATFANAFFQSFWTIFGC